jgi:hypothetical protein
MPPAFNLCSISILREALKIFLGELWRRRLLPGELLANEGISGHVPLKRSAAGHANCPIHGVQIAAALLPIVDVEKPAGKSVGGG